MPLRVSILSIMCTNDVHEHRGFAYTLLFISKNKDERSRGTLDEAQKLQTTKLVRLFWMQAGRWIVDTQKCNFPFI